MPPLESTALSLPLLIRRRALRGVKSTGITISTLFYIFILKVLIVSLSLVHGSPIAPQSSARDRVRVSCTCACARACRVSKVRVRLICAQKLRSARARRDREPFWRMESGSRVCARNQEQDQSSLAQYLCHLFSSHVNVLTFLSCGDRRPPLAFTSTTSTKENLLRLIYCPSRPVATR